jgi:hypothetical protein
MEGNTLVEHRNKVFSADKNANSLTQIEKLITRHQPDVLVLYDVKAKGIYRWPRIKELHRSVVTLAKMRQLKVATVSGIELRTLLLNDPKGTKHDLAERMAKQFPDELASRVPPKRKPWTSEANRMDIFEAVALAVGFVMKQKQQLSMPMK